ncbi:pyrimidine/purine nucleoside phosphorylase [Halobacterium yunchengense]|uniref:pyrimidine/purine nucleoside phosphorylase n=1 Tax=Halobacterium yunchengense TaxID=3108497 RepID=UPI00300B2954
MAADAFEDATVQKRANVYYDGRVTSRELTADGDRYTLGVVLPGSYEFETETTERIEVLAGSGRLELPDGTVEFAAGDEVTVPADTAFEFVADDVVDYCCAYE